MEKINKNKSGYKIIEITTESSPFFKAGGLGDACAGISQSLSLKANDVRVFMPLYSSIRENFKVKRLISFELDYNNVNIDVSIYALVYRGITHYFFEANDLFLRKHVYNYTDEPMRFEVFTYVVINALPKLKFKPDIIHYHDWHMGMLPYILRTNKEYEYYYKSAKTVLTIHNFGYKGNFNVDEKITYFHFDEYSEEYKDLVRGKEVSFMRIGIKYSDVVTTVSETYAKEIMQEIRDEKIDCNKKIIGITNGLDFDKFDPENDAYLYSNFSIDNIETGKMQNKVFLLKSIGLKNEHNRPLIIMIARIINDKGYDLISQICSQLLSENLNFIIMGDGDRDLINQFMELEENFSDSFRIFPYEDKLASQLYAAADIFLMPSHYEPCGTTQMICMRYGVIPIVRNTGGLKDTIIDFDENPHAGNGFKFYSINKDELKTRIEEVIKIYENKAKWKKIINNGYNSVKSWKEVIDNYIDVFIK